MAADNNLTDMEKDALKETANVGAGNASIALSDIVNKKVQLVISDIRFIQTKDVDQAVDGPKSLIVGIYTPITKGMSGNIVIMLKIESAKLLAATIEKTAGNGEYTLNDEDQKTLKKIGNVVAGQYIDSLNRFLDLQLDFENTNIVSTFGEEIIDILMLSIDANAKDALLIKTNFSVDATEINGEFVMLLAINSLDGLLETIRQKING